MIYFTNLTLNTRGKGVVASETIISLPSVKPNSLQVFFKLGLVAASMEVTLGMYSVLFFPSAVVVVKAGDFI